MTNPTHKLRFHADLNPLFPARHQLRWALFVKRTPTEPGRLAGLTCASRQAAERWAAKFNARQNGEA